MSDAYIIGVGMTALGKFPERSVRDLARETVAAALKDADIELSAIQAAWFSNTRQGLLEGQNAIRGQCALGDLGFGGIAVTNVENACASGSTALRQAWAHLKAGMCDIALVVGAEKMFFPEKRDEMFRAFMGSVDVEELSKLKAALATFPGVPDFARVRGESDKHSFFMDIYAAIARLHMKLYGTSERQIALVASKNHMHSTHNPMAQYRYPMSVEQVLADVPISWPLTRSMCAPISDGAAALIICSDSALRKRSRRRAVKIAAISLRSGMKREPHDFDHHIGRLAAIDAFEYAGTGPSEIDVAEVHDACSFAEILQIENLGLCPRGEGGIITDRGETTLGGRVPVNPSGGLVSKGHPVGATGLIQLVELVTQLRGEAGLRQVEGAKVAAAENGGGFWGIEEAATTVTLLQQS